MSLAGSKFHLCVSIALGQVAVIRLHGGVDCDVFLHGNQDTIRSATMVPIGYVLAIALSC